MTILDQIINRKRLTISENKAQRSLLQLEQSRHFGTQRKDFANALNVVDKAGIIAEFKRCSPSKGWIKENADVIDIATGYETAGAAALSILTDKDFFGGCNQDLETAREAVSLPILRKDFIVDEYQIVEACSIGADAILLIAAALSEKEIKCLAAFANSLGLEVLLEVHTESEIPGDFSNISAIGVNNRNLKDFSVDINRSIKIAAQLPSEIIKISESGLKDAKTIRELQQAGFKGFLIGETFMKSENPAAACANLINELKN